MEVSPDWRVILNRLWLRPSRAAWDPSVVTLSRNTGSCQKEIRKWLTLVEWGAEFECPLCEIAPCTFLKNPKYVDWWYPNRLISFKLFKFEIRSFVNILNYLGYDWKCGHLFDSCQTNKYLISLHLQTSIRRSFLRFLGLETCRILTLIIKYRRILWGREMFGQVDIHNLEEKYNFWKINFNYPGNLMKSRLGYFCW